VESLTEGAKQREAVAVSYPAPLRSGLNEYNIQDATPPHKWKLTPFVQERYGEVADTEIGVGEVFGLVHI